MGTETEQQSLGGIHEGQGFQDWLFTLSKGVNLWNLIKKQVSSYDFNVDLYSVRCFTGSHDRLFIVLDDNFQQLLVILDVEKWKEQSFGKLDAGDAGVLSPQERMVIVHQIQLDSNPEDRANSYGNTSDIRRVAVNPSGCFAAFIGGACFMVLNVYPSLAITSRRRSRTYWMQPPVQIADAKWHPLSSSFCHIAILTVDGRLELYDYSDSRGDPEQVFSFAEGPLAYPSLSSRLPEVSSKATYRLRTSKFPGSPIPNSKNEFVAFSFNAAPKSGLRALSVYVVNASGSIWTICGVIPSKLLV